MGIWEKEEYGAMNQSLVFKTEKVTGRITRIYAFATELMYLVEDTDMWIMPWEQRSLRMFI